LNDALRSFQALGGVCHQRHANAPGTGVMALRLARQKGAR
jgi:hypothetical protein